MRSYKKKEQLEKLFRDYLVPRAKKMDVQRNKIKKKIILYSCIYIIALSTIFYFGQTTKSLRKEHFSLFASFSFSVLFSLYLIWFYYSDIKIFKKTFKQNIIYEIFNILIEDCTYKPDKKLSRYDFDRSSLGKHFNDYRGEDYVHGKIGEVQIEFSELLVRFLSRQKIKTIFKGLLFKCTFAIKVKTPLLIKTDFAEKILGRNPGRLIQKRAGLTGYELVQLESIEFEKNFAVYAKDQIKARVILKPSTIALISDFIIKYKGKIEMSIIDKNLYIMVHSHKNYFEPAIFSDIVKWKDVLEFYELFTFIANLVDHLESD